MSDALQKIRYLTDTLLPGLGYVWLLKEGRITRLDLAIDRVGQPPPYLVYKPRAKHYSHAQGHTTFYVGSSSSPLGFAIYNKSEQAKATGQPGYSLASIYRFEARLRRIPWKFYELPHTLSNPFDRLILIDRAAAAGLSHDPAWQSFLQACVIQHVGPALVGLKESQRRKYRKMLLSARAKWWLPPKSWQPNLKIALRTIDPWSDVL